MSPFSSRPWWPTTPQAAATLALSLRASGSSRQLFELCTVAAASQEWEIFAGAMAALCDVGARSIRNMVETAKFDSSWGILYGLTSMPADLFPLFIEVLKVARRFQPAADERAARAQRLAVLQQALSSPDLQLLTVPAEFEAALLA
ncbi:MAG: hypothetical protein K1X51_13670 [Rhodospirillaceae bacterium]|nr:hypothetical protein [Rhodospirillaceae bacterium]